MALGQQIRNAIGTVWRGALAAASAGQSAFQTISSAISDAIGQGLTPPLIDLTTQQQIASLAQGMEAAKQAFGSAPPDSAIDASMISLAPWSMDLNAFNASPAYTFQIGFTIPGNPETQFRVLTGITDLPATVQGAIDLATANAAALLPTEGASATTGDVAAAAVDSVTITVSAPLAA